MASSLIEAAREGCRSQSDDAHAQAIVVPSSADWGDGRDSKGYHHREVPCPSGPDDPNMFAAGCMTGSNLSVDKLYCHSVAVEGYCCSVQIQVRLGVDREVDCGRSRPVQRGEMNALRAMVAEGFVGTHGYSMVDSDVLARMEGKDLTVLATAPQRALAQTYLLGNSSHPAAVLNSPAELLSPGLWTVPLFCYLSTSRSHLSIFRQPRRTKIDLDPERWPMEYSGRRLSVFAGWLKALLRIAALLPETTKDQSNRVTLLAIKGCSLALFDIERR